MVLESNEPPKKKLKQAQLTFFASKSSSSQKRKIESSSPEPVSPVAKVVKIDDIEKENRESNSTELSKSKGRVGGEGELSSVGKFPKIALRAQVDSSDDTDVVVLEDSCDSSPQPSSPLKEIKTPKDEDKSSPKGKGSSSKKVKTKGKGKQGKKSPGALKKTGTKEPPQVIDVCSEDLPLPEEPQDDSPLVLKVPEDTLDEPSSTTNQEQDGKSETPLNISTVSSSENESDVEPMDTSVDTSVNSPKTPQSATKSGRALTPKQLKLKEERDKAREEKLRIKEEKKQARLKELEEKKKKRLEEIELKNEEKRKKEEAKELERRQKEEAKEKEKRLKEEEKRLKEEAKELEKRKKEEERKRKDEAKEEERKKKEEKERADKLKEEKTKAVFASFFKTKKSSDDKSDDKTENSQPVISFMPFPVKNDMRLCDVTRSKISEEGRSVLDSIQSPDFVWDQKLYLDELKAGKETHTSRATWPLTEWQEYHDVIIIESTTADDGLVEQVVEGKTAKPTHKAKLLQFCENRRPPYWGTWTKKSSGVTARRPFGRDKVFDYELDSDAEWEDEEEGESLEEEDEKEKETSDDEQVTGENGYILDSTFVPHGYLSEEEGDDEEEDNLSPEAQKLRLIALKQEFDEEMNQKTERLKPRLLGCVWVSNETSEVSKGSLYERLISHRAVWDEESGPIDLLGEPVQNPDSSPPKSNSNISKKFPPSVFEPLVKLVHGSQLPLSQLVREFLSQVDKIEPSHCVTKTSLTRKIKDIATKSVDPTGRHWWSVNDQLRTEYGLKTIEELKPAPVQPPPPPQPEPPKATLLDAFLKGTTGSSPTVHKKRAQLITLSDTPSTSAAPTSPATPTVSTPSPAQIASSSSPTSQVVKKRANLITLSRTPQTSKTPYVHVDTPRPTQPYFHVQTPPESPSVAPKVVDTIDLSDD